MILEKLYDAIKVDVLPKGLEVETLIRFLKDTQNYEWSMINTKSDDAITLLKEKIKMTPSLYRFTKPLNLAELEITLAYLDATLDPFRPMMTNYHKNRVILYHNKDSYKLYLNGQPFASFNEPSSDALLVFTLKEKVLYLDGHYFAEEDKLEDILSIDELFKLVRYYAYMDEKLILPSYQAYKALEHLRRISYVSLNKRFILSLGKADDLKCLSFLTANLLTNINPEKTCVDTLLILGNVEERIKFWVENYKKVAGETARLMKVENERDMMVAMSRDIEVVFLEESLLDLFFMYLPNWRTKKIAYLVTDELKNGDYLWEKLAYRSEKERSMVLCFQHSDAEKTLMNEIK